MKGFASRAVPVRRALLIVALALLATVVTGRQGEDLPLSGTRASSASKEGPKEGLKEVPRAAEEEIDISSLARLRQEGERADLFSARSWVPPPPPLRPAPAPQPAVAPAPTAPALPFGYFGHMEDAGRLIVFLLKGNDPVNAAVGDTIDNMYRLETVSETAITFVYLPLGTRQTLAIPASP